MKEEKIEKPLPSEKTLPPDLKIIADLIEQCTSHGFFGTGFDVNAFLKKLEFRGLTADFLTDPMLALILGSYRKQAIADTKSEEDVDNTLKTMSTKLGVDVNKIRRIFYTVKSVVAPTKAIAPTKDKEAVEEEEEK